MPSQFNSHPLSFAVVEGSAVIFVEQERAVGARINRNGKRLIYSFRCVLLDRTKRQNRSGAHIERHDLQRNFTRNFAAAFAKLACPEIVPAAPRKINLARGRAL